MIEKIFNKFKSCFKELDKKILKILKNGLRFCFLIALISVSILITYLFFIHNNLIYQIGIMIFEISLYFSVYFIVSAIAVDSIYKHAI